MAEFIDAVSDDDLLDESALVIEVKGREIALVRSGGEVYALQNECSHAGQALGDGELIEEGVLECPGHGATFNVATGEVIGGPATEPVETFDVEVVDGMIRVAIE